MKKCLLVILFCLCAMVTINVQSSAQTLIHYWNFNVDSAAALTPTSSIVTGAGLSYAGSYYDTVELGTTLNGVGADGTSLSAGDAALRLRNPATGPFTLTLPTTGFKDIILAYAEIRTNKGSQQNIVTYTVDGTNWINTAIAATATYAVDSVDTGATSYQLESFNFSSDVNVNNNPNFKVRITFAVGDTNSSGNDRFDNITVYGISDTSHTGITSGASLVPGYVLYPNPAISSIGVDGVWDGDKSITVNDAVGQEVYKGIKSGKHFSINTSQFAPGNYFITIIESNTGKRSAMKFVKQ